MQQDQQDNQQNVLKKRSSIIKILLKMFGVLVIFIFAFIAFIATSTGQRQLLLWADRFSESLTIDAVSGGLNDSDGLAIHNLQFKTDDTNISFVDARIKLPYRCFLQGQLCLDELSLINPVVHLLIAPSKEKEELEEEKASEFSLPLALKLNNIQVRDLDVNINGHQINLGKFSTGIDFTTHNLSIKPTKINHVLIALSKSNEEKTSAPIIEKKLPTSTPENNQKVDWDGLEERLRQPLFTLQDINLPFALSVEDLTAKNWLFKQSDDENDQITVEKLSVAAYATGNEVKLEKLILKSSIANIEGEGKLTTVGDYPVSLNLMGDFPVFFKGHYFNNVNWMHLFFSQDNQLKVSVVGGLNQTIKLVATSKGALNLDLEANVQLTSPKMPYSLKIISEKVQYPFDPKAKNPYRFENVTIEGGGDLLGYNAQVRGNFVGKNTPKAPINLKVKGNLSEVTVENLQLDVAQSHANFQGYLSWRNHLQWTAKLNLDQFNFEKYVFTNVPELKTLQGFPSILSGNLVYSGYWDFYDGNLAMQLPSVQLVGKISHQPFSLKTQMSLTANKFDLATFDLHYHKNRINGAGQISAASDFALNIDAPNLQGLVPTLKATIVGDIRIKEQQGKINLSGKNIHFQDMQLASFTLNSDLQNNNQFSGQLALLMNNLRYPLGNISQLKLDLKGDEENHQLNLSAQGKPMALDLNLSGNYSRSEGIWTGNLSNAVFQNPTGIWQNNRKIDVIADINLPQINIDAHCWRSQQAGLCFPKTLKIGQLGDISFETNNFNLAALNSVMPQSRWQGVINSSGQINWQEHKPFSLEAKLNGRDIQLSQQIDYHRLHFMWPHLNMDIVLSNNKLNAKAQTEMLILDKKKQLQKGLVNLNLKVDDLAKKRNLSGQLGIENLSLSVADQLLARDESVEGVAFADLRFGGTLQSPLLMGDLGVKNVRASIKMLPFDVKNGDLVINFNGQGAIIKGVIQSSKSEMNISGNAKWQDLAHYQGQLRVYGENFYLNLPLTPTYAELKMSPNVLMKVDNDSLTVQGKVDIPWANIDVKALPESGVSVSPDLVILDGANKTEENKLLAMAKTGKTIQGRKIFANLKIKIGDNVKLKAYGLKTFLKGELAVTQQKGELGLYGQVHLDKGTFIAYGQNLIIKNGYIGFSGLPSKPILNVNAIRNPTEMLDHNVTAGIRITGSAMSPRIKVYAKPTMSDEQAFSYLLTGQPIDGDDGTGGAAGAALLSLTLSQTGNSLSSIGSTFGIKNLNVGATGTGDNSQVTVSGNITDYIQLRYGIGLFTGLAEFTVRLRLLPNLYLQSVSSVNQAVDLFYQFEI